MRTKSMVRLVAAFAVLCTGASGRAQGSWLPYGTIGASDVAVSPTGVVWLIGKEPRSIRSTLVLGETRFVTPPGMPAHVAVDLNGFPWLLNTDASVWHFTRNSAGKEDWTQSPLRAIDIAVGSSGEVWAIDTEQHVVHLKDGAWESIGGAGQKIAVDPSGNPWVVNATGQISHWVGNSWVQVPGTANDISVSPDGSVFILGTTRVRGGFEVLRLNGNQWEEIAGGGGVAISAGAKSVFVAQDTTTYLVLSSVNTKLRVATADDLASATSSPSSRAAQSETPPTTGNATTVVASAAAASAVTSGSAPAPASSNTTQAPQHDAGTTETSTGGSGASIPHPSAGTVVGALGALGGLLGKAAPAVIPAIPNPNAVAQAAAGAAAGAVAGAVAGEAIGAAGNIAGKAAGGVVSSGASSAASSAPASVAQTAPQNVTQSASKNATQSAAQQASAPEHALAMARTSWKLPTPGSLRCPIIGGGATMEHACEKVGRAALQLWHAPSSDCAAPAFADSRNGGECWKCPAEFTRGSSPVDAADACVGPAAQHAVATLVKGCATSPTPPGYGTPFRDSQNGGECFACPLPLQRSWSAVASLTKGNISACFGKAKQQLLVWQLGQFPEVGAYHFMPGLLSIALADPKAVDAYLEKRALGDTAKKREMWAQMIADPSGSAELKALLFASLLSVAKKDSVSAEATGALHDFESYVQARRTYVANEALRMYSKARQVDSIYRQAKDSAGSTRSAAVQTALTDFKTYAWSAVVPDSAGTAFVVASAALAQLGTPGAPQTAFDSAAATLNVRYLVPVTTALNDRLGKLQSSHADMIRKADSLAVVANDFGLLKGADVSMIGTTLLGSAMKASNGFMSMFSKGRMASEYAKYVKDMSVPVRVRSLLDSTNPDDQQTLLLYWALATSAHTASDKIGEGALTGTDLCNADSWTAAECSSAKSMVLAAARAVGYSN